MKRIHTPSFLLILAVTTHAWAGGGAYPPDAETLGASPLYLSGASSLTRAQVIAEMQEAQRLGLMSSGEGDAPIPTAAQQHSIGAAGQHAAGLSPGTVAAAPAPAETAGAESAAEQATRTRVHAELGEAQRLGLMQSGESGATAGSPAQEAMIRAAGQQAVDRLSVAPVR